MPSGPCTRNPTHQDSDHGSEHKSSGGLNQRPDRFRPGLWMVCVLFLAALCMPLPAQRAGQALPPNSPVNASSPADPRSRDLDDAASLTYQMENREPSSKQTKGQVCLFEPYPGLSRTVSVHSLQVPDKVQNEYQKACVALGVQKLTDSEQHLRKALKIDPADALGWVMLGKVLEFEEQWDEASRACSEAAIRDPSYWAADLCLSEIDGREQKWTNSLAESNLALALNPAAKKYADYFGAVALFNLDKVPDAELRALEAAQLDTDHMLASVEFLLARIDEAKGDSPAAVTAFQEYLKYAKDPREADLAKKELMRLETPNN
jgi:hypothetical protein